MTLAQIIDVEILLLGRARSSTPGTPSTANPYPTKLDYNLFTDLAIRKINRECFSASDGSTKSVAVAAQTNLGPYLMDISGGFGSTDTTIIDDVFAAWWNDGTTASWPMERSSPEQIRRDYQQWYVEVPSTPSYYWIDGKNLALFPAPSVAGTLYAMLCAKVDLPGYEAMIRNLKNAGLVSETANLLTRNRREGFL